MRNFRKDESGAMFMIFAVAMPVILICSIVIANMLQTQGSHDSNSGAVQSAAQGAAEFIEKSRMDGVDTTQEEVYQVALEILKSNNSLDQSNSVLDMEEFSVVFEGDKVEVRSCMNAASGAVCAQSVANVIALDSFCSGEIDYTTESCPNGQYGNITYKNEKICPSGETVKSSHSNTCKTCTPTSTDKTISCPNGLVGSIVMTTTKSCPSEELTTTQKSYSCEKPCEQKVEESTEACSKALKDSKATGFIKKTRISECPSEKFGSWIQQEYSCCVPKTETRKKSCPSGEEGAITEERTKSCPSGKFNSWKKKSDTCKATKDIDRTHEACKDFAYKPGEWVKADFHYNGRPNDSVCVTTCEKRGMVSGTSPEGMTCASGEARPLCSHNLTYDFGTWGAGNRTGKHTIYSYYAWRHAKGGPQCYGVGQKRDRDWTDIVSACWCDPK